jgi:diadenosine tetraphosphatase ApaH/serine/threonine PP2A family protein phosphatase
VRYLFFSDVHSNLEALVSVLDDAAKRGIDRTICLGDIVGYGASPEECVKTISDLPNAAAVLGNHDAAVVDPKERVYLNPVAQAGVKFSETKLSAESMSYLKSLEFIIESENDFIASHASPYKPESWVYVLEPVEASDAFHVMTHPVAFIGHTHFPVVHNSSGLIKPILPGDRIAIREDEKAIINVGSVGQPRDGDPRAAYIIYDDESRIAEVFRVEYDIETASKKILDTGLPPMLADRIRRGY